jgi:hypothetical protein
MSERLEAVAKSLADEDGWTSYSDATKALAAADAVMFSDKAVRAHVVQIIASHGVKRPFDCADEVFAALKGAGDE